MDNDTIAALATAPGRGGIAVVRVSGPGAMEALEKLFTRKPPYEDKKMMYGHALDLSGETLDECMAVMMFAPKTYTREDVAEFHLHGGAWSSTALLKALNQMGIRPAEPGEFTKRAFLNGRIDLTRAEAVMKIISAESEQAARTAMRQLKGGVNAFVENAMEKVLHLTAGVEAALDYPEEIDEEEACGTLLPDTNALILSLENACDERAGSLAEHGLNVVLCGAPNVGKSSLMNALTGQDHAIVTDIPGTTRDVVTAAFYLNGVRVNLLDTAGLRESEEAIERLGVKRAEDAIARADLCLVVSDGTPAGDAAAGQLLNQLKERPRLTVFNKCDLNSTRPGPEGERALHVSALTGEGLDALKEAIGEYTSLSGEAPLVSARHIALAREAAEALRNFAADLTSGQTLEAAAVYLRQALDALGRITGDRVDEKLLDEVFSTFCVGK